MKDRRGRELKARMAVRMEGGKGELWLNAKASKYPNGKDDGAGEQKAEEPAGQQPEASAESVPAS